MQGPVQLCDVIWNITRDLFNLTCAELHVLIHIDSSFVKFDNLFQYLYVLQDITVVGHFLVTHEPIQTNVLQHKGCSIVTGNYALSYAIILLLLSFHDEVTIYCCIASQIF